MLGIKPPSGHLSGRRVDRTKTISFSKEVLPSVRKGIQETKTPSETEVIRER